MSQVDVFYESLTDQENVVLELLAEDLSNNEIAERLFLSSSTIKWYVRQLNSKLGTSNRQEIVERAFALGLLQRETEILRHPPSLPGQMTPFVGRESEKADVLSLIEDDSVRLVTILGPGGMGKTRLALEVASDQMSCYEDGVYFVDLIAAGAMEDQVARSPLDDEEHVILMALAQGIGYTVHSLDRPLKDQLLSFLSDQHMLLVLDNFEHLLDGAGVIVDILRQTAQVDLIITSRERLNLSIETVYPLQGMSKSTQMQLEAMREADSVQLLIQSARRMKPDFELTLQNLKAVMQICELTDGMPLGLLLASAWLDVLTIDEIAAEIQKSVDFLDTEIRDIPDRQRSLRAVFSSAWSRLSADEQTVFMKLSVLRGKWSLEAAGAIAGASLRILKKLVGKSLAVQISDGRYHLHELLRQYAEEKLEHTLDAVSVRAAHCGYYAEFVHQWAGGIETGQQLESIAELEGAFENIREAWLWAVYEHDADALEKLMAIWYFMDFRSRWHEASELFDIALDNVPTDSPLWAMLAARMSMFTMRLGMSEKTHELARRSIDILKRHNHEAELAMPLNSLGVSVFFSEGDIDEAERLLTESLQLAQRHGDRRREAIQLGNLSIMKENRGNLDEATAYLHEQLRLASKIGDNAIKSLAYLNLGEIALQTDDLVMAQRYCRQSLEAAESIGQQHVLMWSLGILGTVAFKMQDYETSARYHQQSLRINKAHGDIQHIVRNLSTLGEIAMVRRQHADACAYYHEALTYVAQTKHFDDGLLLLNPVAQYLVERGNISLAVKTLTFVSTHEATRYDKRDEAAECCEKLRSDLEPSAFDAAVGRGLQMDFDTVLTTLLETLTCDEVDLAP